MHLGRTGKGREEIADDKKKVRLANIVCHAGAGFLEHEDSLFTTEKERITTEQVKCMVTKPNPIWFGNVVALIFRQLNKFKGRRIYVEVSPDSTPALDIIEFLRICS
ncbi:unnamed protein product [Allacma fusca]|uniref:Uncharacterized protein n=1 Tax=Allacma fusca TaxID=39272 RepID=A0A8J2J4Z6_9HEXA|nr:unnamed protein product [Allacma fusca]